MMRLGFALLVATVTATGLADNDEALSMFKVSFKKNDYTKIKQRYTELDGANKKYQAQLQSQGEMAKIFQRDMKAIAQTAEFKALAKNIPEFKKNCKTAHYKCGVFLRQWRSQQQRVINAQNVLARTPSRNTGDVVTRDFNNEAWLRYNKEYFKLKQLQYKGMYGVPAFVLLRKHMRAVVATKAWDQLEKDWKTQTQSTYHQAVVAKQEALFTTAVKSLHVADQDKKWVSLKKSSVLFETFHAMFIYFKAMKNGDIDPIASFLIDGTYDQDYMAAVRPDFWGPKSSYLI